MTGVSLPSMDHDLHQLLLNTLQNRYPMRVASVLLVRAPWVMANVRFKVVCAPPSPAANRPDPRRSRWPSRL
jgi:hypothetical protein